MPPEPDPRLAALLDKQEIEEVVLRYCRGIDRRDFELVRSCYHPDARDRHGSFDGTVDEYVSDRLCDMTSRVGSTTANCFHLTGRARRVASVPCPLATQGSG